MGGGAIGIFLLTLVAGNAFIARDKAVTREMLGHDFLAFYTAGSFVREGRYHDLYKLDAVKEFEGVTSQAAGLEVGKSFGPWWNPPFYAMVFEPLAGMPYAAALNAWRWISLAAVAGAIGILAGFVARADSLRTMGFEIDGASMLRGWRAWGLVPLLVVVSMPFIQAISHGQNTYTSLLLLVLTVALWRGQRGVLAGVVGGLLFYKPQLGAVVAAVMVIDLGWSAFWGFAITGGILLGVSLVTMPGAISDYLHLLPANVRWMQIEHMYLWERHVTLKAFWRLLLQGREAGEPWLITRLLTYLSTAAMGIALGWAVLWGRSGRPLGHAPLNESDRRLRRDRIISATICTMPLLMPFYFDYDLLLLAVPAVLYGAERVSRPELARKSDARVTGGWVLLFLWLFVNPGIAMRSHVNATVVLLTALAAMMVMRTRTGVQVCQTKGIEEPRELRTAA